ncbi:MAG: serine/threonine-protein kinase [Myxococcota bacterium]
MTETRTEILDEVQASPMGGARPGQKIGKYLIRNEIGAGGCGTVYAAYDPLLERDVAIKLLARTRASDSGTVDPGWPRLVREARMLARLSEPQVVTVYDVGDEDGQPFLAMQMVDGGDLKDWVARHRGADAADPKPLSEALALLEQAGRGLAVAHEAGVVHGDFKPANVLIDARGRAKVSDFGIARLAEAVEPLREDEATQSAEGLLDTGEASHAMDRPARTFTTSQGRPIVGTPAYMAPEQFTGRAADVASDVYAFCATLYHVVYARLPFSAKTIAAIAAKKTAGNLEFPATPTVPGWLSRLLIRGLSVERQARPRNMAAVLAEFERGRSKPKRRWFLVGGALGGAGIVAGAMAWGGSAGGLRCRDDTARDFPWTESASASVASGFGSVATAGAAPVIERITAQMDTFAGDWRETYEAACTAAWAEPQLADQAFACLRRRRSMAAALLEAWGEPSAPMIDAAFAAVSALPSVTACVDAEALAGQPDLPQDPTLRERVIDTRERIDASTAMARTRALADARVLAQSAFEQAEAIGYEPLVAQAALAYGQSLEIAGEMEPARERLRQAFFGSQRWDDHETAASAAERLVFLVGTRLDEHEQGLLWVEHARVALAKTGGSTAVLTANEGSILDRLGRHDEALARYRESLAVHDPADPYGHGVTHLRMGDALRARGRAEEALQQYDQAAAKWAEALGPEHPRLAIVVQSRATALSKLDRDEEAIAAYRSAIEGLTKMFGPDHINISAAYVNLGLSLKYLERFDEAEAAMREALRIAIIVYGEEQMKVAHRRDALGRLLTLMERGDEAVVEHAKAKAIYDQGLPSDHPDRVIVRMHLGDAHQSLGDHDQAVAEYEAAVAAAAGGKDEELHGDALASLGRGLVRAGRPDEGRPRLKEAIKLLAESERYADSRKIAKEWLAKIPS